MKMTDGFNHNNPNKDKTELGTKNIDYIMMDFLKIYEISCNFSKLKEKIDKINKLNKVPTTTNTTTT